MTVECKTQPACHVDGAPAVNGYEICHSLFDNRHLSTELLAQIDENRHRCRILDASVKTAKIESVTVLPVFETNNEMTIEK